MARLVLLLLATVVVVCSASGSSLIGNQHVKESGRRQLSGNDWSFANLLYHLHACPKPNHCPGGPKVGPLHPCGCPDCSKPHPNDPDFAHGYCYTAVSSAAESYESVYDVTETNATVSDESTSNNNTPANESANWVFNPLYYLIGAAAMGIAVAGLILKKRKRSSSNEHLLNDVDEEDRTILQNISRHMVTISAGAGAVVAAGFGRTRKAKHSNQSDEDTLSGSVSRRLRTLEAGSDDGAASCHSKNDTESTIFVNVPSSAIKNTPRPTLVERPDSVEVEGPYRPSIYAASV